MKKTLLVCFLLVFVAIGSVIFIKNNNDHKECSTTVDQSKDADGNVVRIEKHICKENYNL